VGEDKTMLNLSEQFWYWAFRYTDNTEIAILVATHDECFSGPVSTSKVIEMIHAQDWIDTTRLFFMTKPASAEWKTWLAFELCPAIEIYEDNTKENNMGWRRIEL
jgi:hypothetical protein